MTRLVIYRCRNCDHEIAHNVFGRCAEPGCGCRNYDPDRDSAVVAIRNPENLRPVLVPDEVVREVERSYGAYLDRLAGKSWAEIAAEKGWPSAEAASAEVKRYMDEGRAVLGQFARREAIAMEIARLDALQQAVWADAMAGKIPAVQQARGIITDRLRALGIGQGEEESGDAVQTTLVVGDDSYADTLRQVAESQSRQRVEP